MIELPSNRLPQSIELKRYYGWFAILVFGVCGYFVLRSAAATLASASEKERIEVILNRDQRYSGVRVSTVGNIQNVVVGSVGSDAIRNSLYADLDRLGVPPQARLVKTPSEALRSP